MDNSKKEKSFEESNRKGKRNPVLKIAYLLFLIGLFMVPPFLLVSMIFTIFLFVISYRLVKEPGVIDIGYEVFKPLAKFKIGANLIRIQLFL